SPTLRSSTRRAIRRPSPPVRWIDSWPASSRPPARPRPPRARRARNEGGRHVADGRPSLARGAYSVAGVPQSPKHSRAGSLVTWNGWGPARSIVYRSPFQWNRMVVPSGDQTGPNSWAVGLLAIRYGVAAPDATSTPYSFASLETSRDLPSGAQ